MKSVNFLRPNAKLFALLFEASFAIIALGFLLICSSSIDMFFGQNPWLFYLLFFGPMACVAAAYIVVFLVEISLQQAKIYRKFRSEGLPAPDALAETLKRLMKYVDK